MMRQQCLRMHKLLFCSIIIWTYHHYHLNLCLITLSTQVVNYPLFAFVPSRSKQWCGLLVLNKEREKIITSLLSVVHHIAKACTNKISERCILYSIKDVRKEKFLFFAWLKKLCSSRHRHSVHSQVNIFSTNWSKWTHLNKLIVQYKHVYISWKASSILTRTMRRHDQELFLCLKKILNRINSYSVRSLCSTAFLSWKVSSCGVIYCVGDFYVNQVSSFLVILVSYSHLLELDRHRFFTHALI